MAARVRHAKVVTIPDDPSYPVGSDEWNGDHVITGLENVDNTSDANKPVSTAQAAAIASGIASVTKASIGLGNADNTSDANKPVSTAQAAAIASGIASVTKASIGLGNADNTSDAGKPVSTAQAAAIAVVQADIDGHQANTANPHSVTKAQVGLGNVPNVDATIASNVNFVDSGTGGTSRSVAQIISDFSHSVANYGVVGNGATPDDVNINRALAAQKAVFFPPGSYLLNGPLVSQPGAIIEGPGYTKVRIQRNGVWAGDTLTVSADAQVRGLLFEQLHPGFVFGATTLVDRLTSDQAHITVLDGTGPIIENCWVNFGVYGVKLLATTRASVRDIQATGTWDALNGAVCETKALIYIGSTVARPFNTEPTIERCYMGAGNVCPARNITIGTVTFSAQLGAGCQDTILLEGAEGAHIKSNYMAANRFGVNVTPTRLCREITIDDNFIDAPSTSGIFITASGGQSLVGAVISRNKFNGQLLAGRAITVDNSGSVVNAFGLVVSDNLMFNHLTCPMYFPGLKAASIHNNIVNNYHCRGGDTNNPASTAGLLVGGVSTNVEARDNYYGGGANDWSATNNCQFGEFFGGPTFGRSGGANGILGLAGGAMVSGVTPLY